MFQRVKYILMVIGLVVSGLWLRGCFKDNDVPPTLRQPLSENTAAQVVVQDRKIVARSQKETKAGYIPEDGWTTVLIEKDGTVRLDIKSYGWTFRPVIGPMLSDKLRVAGGVQFGFWKRFEIYGGGAAGSENGKLKFPCAFIALGYRLDQIKLRNTSVYVSYNTSQEIGTGLFLRF